MVSLNFSIHLAQIGRQIQRFTQSPFHYLTFYRLRRRVGKNTSWIISSVRPV